MYDLKALKTIILFLIIILIAWIAVIFNSRAHEYCYDECEKTMIELSGCHSELAICYRGRFGGHMGVMQGQLTSVDYEQNMVVKIANIKKIIYKNIDLIDTDKTIQYAIKNRNYDLSRKIYDIRADLNRMIQILGDRDE